MVGEWVLSVENKETVSVRFESRREPKVKVTLEFAGEKDGAEVEKEFADVLMQAYLERIWKGEGV